MTVTIVKKQITSAKRRWSKNRKIKESLFPRFSKNPKSKNLARD